MTPQERHNALCNVTGETLWGFQVALILPTTVLTVLLTQLDASKTTIGLIPSFEGVAMFLSVAGIYLFRSHKKRKLRIILFHYLVFTPCLIVMGLAVLAHDSIPRDVLKLLLIGSWAIFMGGAGIVGAAWMDWVAHLFRQEIRGTITGASWGFSNLAGVAGALISGWALRGNQGLAVYGWLYLAAALFATLSISTFFAIRDPARDLAADHAPGWSEIFVGAVESLSDPDFRSLLAGRCLGLAGFCIGPFVALYYLSPVGGSLPDSLVVTLGSAQTAGSAICCMLFGRIGDRVGHRFGMILGIAFQIAALLSVLCIPGAVGCFFAMLFAGCVAGTILISYLNLVIESCPHEVRSAHILIGNMIVGIAGFIFPLIGARIAVLGGIPVLMKVSLAVSIAALVWSLLRMKDPRRRPAKITAPVLP
jgi:MFS family permease